MIDSAPNDITEMVNMGMKLEEGVREGCLSMDEASTSMRYGSGFSKKKDNEVNAISSGRQRRPRIRRNPSSRQHHHQVSSVISNLIQPRNPLQIPEPLPWWYKPELHCAFYQGAPEHDIENCYPLKYEVQKLMKSGMVSFEDRVPNVKANSLPTHGKSSVNMVDGCHGKFKIVQSRHVDDDVNVIVLVFKQPKRLVIQYDSSNSNSVSNILVSPLVIRLAGPVQYSSDKVVPYQYNATMIEGGQEVPLPTTSSVVSIVDVTKVTRSGRVFGSVFPKDKEESVVGKKVEVLVADPIGASKGKSGESSDAKANDDDEVLRLIKRSEFNMVEQLLQTPLKISVLSLLMNSEAHREALQRVLEQAFVEHDVTIDQFDHIMANITSCNNLSFCDEELPEKGRNHNLALHISMNCK
ncbi:hypothetical protein KIW84_074698 [Lathyrus oleraceus]|uniref:Uncharacterized protein n=1 Tax=Pisum sativum TaxID=3888 RepID=A0A9D4VRX9_PEA|nr:hypothetical protein KIW84_074698 [Pisum sativum]